MTRPEIVNRRPEGKSRFQAVKHLKATGAVKRFNATKSFGFVQSEDGRERVFVPISAMERASVDHAVPETLQIQNMALSNGLS